jgi:hypothetical protein
MEKVEDKENIKCIKCHDSCLHCIGPKSTDCLDCDYSKAITRYW